METLGAVDDTTKLALARRAERGAAGRRDEDAHAGRHERRPAGGAGRRGRRRRDALRLAQDQVERERVRRDAEVERERRHQLDLLALQNDVNKTALASQAQLGAGLAARRGRAGRAWQDAATRTPARRPLLRQLRRAAAGAGMMQTAIDKLRELRALHEDGLLSRQEFDVRKNAILDAAYARRHAPRAAGRAARPGTEIGLMATPGSGSRRTAATGWSA